MPCCRAACFWLGLLLALTTSAPAAPPDLASKSTPPAQPLLSPAPPSRVPSAPVRPATTDGPAARFDILPTSRPANRSRSPQAQLQVAAVEPRPIAPTVVGPDAVAATRAEPATAAFQVPPGFTWQLVAGPPLVSRPISADFDEQGRLYVTDSSGSNEKVDRQLAAPTHQIVRLVDTDGDGVFDSRTLFADRVMFPEGALWHEGSLYVAAPPSLWKFTDRDGDGVAEEREEWYQGKTLTGCANDMHGPFRGHDGCLYWTKGAWAEQTFLQPGRPPLVSKAAHVVRQNRSDRGVEPLIAGGMDNPVDVVFTPAGERFFTTTFLTHPGRGERDGLIHAVYGGVYGKIHAPMEGAPRTGDVLPPLAHLGAAAPCGLACYQSPGWGPEFEGQLLACLFNMRKVTLHELVPQGAGFVTRNRDLVVSESLDFHPTDVLEDADGSVLVLDTGGWYKLCCPTSQLAKPDVLGGIYRLKKTAAPTVADPRGRQIDFAALDATAAARLAADPRSAVWQRAQSRLVERGQEAVPAVVGLLRHPSPRARTRAVWTLSQLPPESASAGLREALRDSDTTVVQAAGHALALNPDPLAREALERVLSGTSAQNARVAAEALGRLRDARAVPALWQALERAGDDRFLEHSILYALWEIGDVPALRQELTSESSRRVRGALVVLDQLGADHLPRSELTRFLDSRHDAVRAMAAFLAGRHADMGAELATWLRRHLASPPTTEGPRDTVVTLWARLARSPDLQPLFAEGLSSEGWEAPRLVLATLTQSDLDQLPAGSAEALARRLPEAPPEVATAAVAMLRRRSAAAAREPALAPALLALAGRDNLPEALGLEALACLPTGGATLPDALFERVTAPLRTEADHADRLRAVDTLARLKLTPSQWRGVATLLPQAGPLEAGRLLALFKGQSDLELGRTLIEQVGQAEAFDSLRPEDLAQALSGFPREVQQLAVPLEQRQQAARGQQREKLLAVLQRLQGLEGDIRRGQKVFHGAKTACIVCHAMGYLGGTAGPDLTRIGGVRAEQDLLESILFPSQSFVRNYEPVLIETKAGKTFGGNVRMEGPDFVLLQTGPREEVRLTREEIAETRAGTVSLMPSGLDQQLTDQDLADLLAFLKSSK